MEDTIVYQTGAKPEKLPSTITGPFKEYLNELGMDIHTYKDSFVTFWIEGQYMHIQDAYIPIGNRKDIVYLKCLFLELYRKAERMGLRYMTTTMSVKLKVDVDWLQSQLRNGFVPIGAEGGSIVLRREI
jgi:hypothetical protein